MNYTKEQIFPLYVGRCKVKFQWLNGTHCIENFLGIDIDKDRIATEIYDNLSISDCTLLLKRLSSMSEGEMLALSVIIYNYDALKLTKTQSLNIIKGIIANDEHIPNCNLKTMNNIFVELIERGYAISDELFELGIAVEQAEEKK